MGRTNIRDLFTSADRCPHNQRGFQWAGKAGLLNRFYGIDKIKQLICAKCTLVRQRYRRSSRKRTPSGREKITGAGRLRECENTEFVWEFNKTGF